MIRTAAVLLLSLKASGVLAHDEADLRAIPKVELHIHLSGAYPLTYLRSIANDRQYAALEEQIARVEKGIPYAEFFRAFAPLSAIVDTDEKVEEGVVALADWLINEGVTYCELRTGLKDLGNGLEGHLQSVLRGMARGSQDKPFTWRLLISVRRENSPKLIEESIDLLIKYADRRHVIGLDLSGNIQAGNTEAICAAVDRVHDAGLPVTVHMGEVPGEADQEDVLERLRPQRIGHGVHLSQAALDYLSEHGTPLEVCLRSSEAAAMLEHHSEHPGHQHMLAEHPISLSTDDPLLFGTSPIYEQALFAACNDLSLQDLYSFNRASFRQLFVQTHAMHCVEPFYSLLRKGTKTVEGRIHSEKWSAIVAGDLIEFNNGTDYFYAEVTAIRHYPDVRSYLETEGLASTLPGVTTVGEGLAIYHQWHSLEEIAACGFLALEIKVLSQNAGR